MFHDFQAVLRFLVTLPVFGFAILAAFCSFLFCRVRYLIICLAVHLHIVDQSCPCALSCICLGIACHFFQFVRITSISMPSFLVVSSHLVSFTGLINASTIHSLRSLCDISWTHSKINI